MADIQVDMFEVQLGAALLLQFKDSGGDTVRVLADAGIKASPAYPQDHVAQKLRTTLRSSAGSLPPIDLLVGTHYDEDHLAGLIDVVQQFQIREAILPPVRKPRHSSAGSTESAAALLDNPDLTDAADLPRLIDLTDEQWEGHLFDLNTLADRADAELRNWRRRWPVNETHLYFSDDEFPFPDVGFGEALGLMAPFSVGGFHVMQLAQIRASARKGAIVAKWLRKLVRELRNKGVPIRAIDVAAGVPEYYMWDRSKQLFDHGTPSAYAVSLEPKFTLLGPSRALVAHHAKRLPIGCYLALAQPLLRKRITASNELSYVMLFEADSQQLLVCGDAGCVDFWDKASKAYHPALLRAVKQPHVVQVAHHAGANDRFYDVLLASRYSSAAAPDSFLLLSHADHDVYRPSFEFEQFVNLLSSTRQNFQLLTTSQPDSTKVSAFRQFYHPTVPYSRATVGDVQLAYTRGAWTVTQHLVQP